ncbi:MAG: pseudaminic acid synthase [Eubacteriales bacterium]|nr:pseudaminic acid synthase [Eubacteriales bacterium]
MNQEIYLGGRRIAADSPTFIVAEMSANHLQDYDRAVRILHAAKEAGADAIKLQTYTADTITLDSDAEAFQNRSGTLWDGTTLHQLYEEASTPWEWHPRLMEEAKKLGLICFSSPFDFTAVDFMAELDMPAFKFASYEINDIPLIRRAAKLHKPMIFATGIARLEDIERAFTVCKEEGNEDVILLKCVSAYPTPYEDINLRVIPTLQQTFGCLTGLSDHSMGTTVAVGAVALGAKMVEKHLTLRRSDGGPDGAFSMEPAEFKEMVDNIRILEKALGSSSYRLMDVQKLERKDSRSLFVVKDVAPGEVFTAENVRSIRPGCGLHPMYYEEILGRKAACAIRKGTPLSWNLVN